MTALSISVVIPAFNATATLARAIASVRAQVFDGEAEIIVADDASRDGTAALAESLGARVVRLNQNGGPAVALKAGIEAARHDLVAFLDADDEWLPGKLAAQVAALRAMPDAVIVATAFTRVDRDGHRLWTYGDAPFAHGPHDFWKVLLADSAILKSSALCRREAVLASGALDSGLRSGEDQLLFQALAATGPVAYVPEPLVLYHDQPGSLTDRVPAASVSATLARHLAAIDRMAGRLTPAERRAIEGKRYAEAANGLVAARAWGPAIAATVRAIAAGEAVAPQLWRLLTNLPPVRGLKRLVR